MISSASQPSVAVVGLGAMGLSACRELARRGANVIGLERHELGHAFGSSHGGTRVIRLAYFEHTDYVPLLQRSMDGFVQLSDASGEPVIERCGVLIAGDEDSGVVAASAESALRHGIEVERLDAAAIDARFPQFRHSAGFDEASPRRGLFEPGGGFVRPERTMKALAELAQRDGAELRDHCEIEGWSTRDDGIELAFSGETRLVDRVVVAAGAWSGRVLSLPGAPGLPMPLEPARQVQAWISPDDPAMAMPDRLPAWLVDRNALPPVYGVPVDPLATPGIPGESRTKIAVHGGGQAGDPDRIDRCVGEDEIGELRRLAARHLPGLGGDVDAASVCLYTNTADGHFLLDRHPDEPRVVLACGFSGHGFKFVPVVGEAVADLALDGSSRLPIGFLGVR